MKPLYTARATATAGRDGRVKSGTALDPGLPKDQLQGRGNLDVKLQVA